MGVIAFTADAYARMQKLLLPPGIIWRHEAGRMLANVFLATGDELVRVSGRAGDLLTESDPRITSELLPEFEAMLSLASTGTEADRRARVVALLVSRQRYRPIDFQNALALILGQAAVDVVVIELDRAHAILVADDREIYRFFIYRDPALPGSYSVADAQAVVDTIKPTHTKGHVIESDDFLCDDPFSLCDRDILGV